VPPFTNSLDGMRHASNPWMSDDLVELWKNVALRGATEQQTSAAPPRLRVTLTAGFILLAGMTGLSWKSVGILIVPSVLLTVLLVHELPRAMVARLLGRASQVILSERGGSTVVSGTPLTGKAALGFTVVGSFANLVVAVTALALVRSRLLVPAAPLLNLIAAGHAAYGIAQLLPIVPFRAGALLSRRLPGSMRLAHAAASFAFLVVLGVAAEHLSKTPQLLVRSESANLTAADKQRLMPP